MSDDHRGEGVVTRGLVLKVQSRKNISLASGFPEEMTGKTVSSGKTRARHLPRGRHWWQSEERGMEKQYGDIGKLKIHCPHFYGPAAGQALCSVLYIQYLKISQDSIIMLIYSSVS